VGRGGEATLRPCSRSRGAAIYNRSWHNSYSARGLFYVSRGREAPLRDSFVAALHPCVRSRGAANNL